MHFELLKPPVSARHVFGLASPRQKSYKIYSKSLKILFFIKIWEDL